MTTMTSQQPRPGFGRALIVGLAAGVAAALVNLIVFFIGGAMGIVFEGQMGPGAPVMPLPAIAFVMASLVPALLGALAYVVSVRFIPRGRAIFIGVALAVAVLSLFSPLTMEVALATRLTLAALHLVTAAIITWGLVRYA